MAVVATGVFVGSALGDDGDACEIEGSHGDLEVLDPAAPSGPRVSGQQYTITLPAGWAGTSVDGDPVAAAEALFPADSEMADRLRRSLEALAETGPDLPDIVARAAPGELDAADGRPSILLVAHFADLGGCSMEEVRDEMARNGGDADIVDLAGREVVRALDGADGGSGTTGVSYLFPEERAAVFVLGPSSPELAMIAEQSAATLSGG